MERAHDEQDGHDEQSGVAGESDEVGAERSDASAFAVPEAVSRAHDAKLVGRARGGDDAAWSELWTRHEPEARRLASRFAAPGDVDDLVSESLTRTLEAIRSGGGPDTAFRPYLLTTLRQVEIEAARRSASPVAPTDDETAVDAEERDAVWAAWRSLPDESRSLLWELVVHEEKPHRLAPRLGTTPNGVASRGKRARERLRHVFLAELVARAGDPQCREARRRLDGYVRDSLPTDARQHVDEHLDRCARCRAAVLDVIDVDAAIRLRVAPVLLPGAFAGAGGAVTGVASAGAVAPEPVLGVEAFLDDIEGLGTDLGAASGGSTVVGRVLSVPGRSVAAVAAAAAIIVAAALFLLQPQPAGQVAADASTGRDSASGTPSGSEPAWPTTTAAPGPSATGGPRPVIGVATAERAGLRGSSGAPDVHPSRPGTPPTPATSTAASPSSSPSASPQTTTPRPAGLVGTVTRLVLAPGGQGTCLAHLEVPDGWLITSVLDRQGSRTAEHVSSPTRVLDDRLRAGRLVIEVTRTRTGVTGELSAWFENRSGEPLAGSGSYPLL